MQSLFEGSDESPNESGLGIIPGRVTKFSSCDNNTRIPHIGWNGITPAKNNLIFENLSKDDTVSQL